MSNSDGAIIRLCGGRSQTVKRNDRPERQRGKEKQDKRSTEI